MRFASTDIDPNLPLRGHRRTASTSGRRESPLRACLALVLAVACVAVPPVAQAVDLGPRQTRICFEQPFARGALVRLDDDGRIGYLVRSRNAVLNEDSDGDLLTSVYLRPSLELLDSTGDEYFSSANYGVTTSEIVSASPTAGDVVPATAAVVPPRHQRYYAQPGVCEGFGTLQYHGQRLKWHANGVAGVDGSSGETDQTVVWLRVFRMEDNTYTQVRTHRIERLGSEMALLSEIKIVDFDADGDDELLVVRATFIDLIGARARFRIRVSAFNIATAELESSFDTIVSDEFVNRNALPRP